LLEKLTPTGALIRIGQLCVRAGFSKATQNALTAGCRRRTQNDTEKEPLGQFPPATGREIFLVELPREPI